MKISTMTYVAKVDTDRDIKCLYDEYLHKSIDTDLYVEDKSTKVTKKGRPKKSFGNQMTIKSRSKKFNLKLFYNKKIQITGMKSLDELIAVFKTLELLFDIKIYSRKLVMKNMVTDLNRQLQLYALYDKMKNMGLQVCYSPEIYPGLKLKHNGVTALIFVTGKMIISTKSVEEPYETEQLVRRCVEDGDQNFHKEPCGSSAHIATA